MTQTSMPGSAGVRVEQVGSFEELMTRIGETITESVAQSDTAGDMDPESVEAQLRQLLPGHACFKTSMHMARGQEGPAPVRVAHVVWSTPTGVWQLTTYPCIDDSSLHHIQVDGPDTDVSRDHLTVSQVVDLLRALGTLPAKP